MPAKKKHKFIRAFEQLIDDVSDGKVKGEASKDELRKFEKRFSTTVVNASPILKNVPGFKEESGKTEAFLKEGWESYECALMDPASPLWRPGDSPFRLHEVKVHYSSPDHDDFLLEREIRLSCRVEGPASEILLDLASMAYDPLNQNFAGNVRYGNGLRLIHWDVLGFWRKVLRQYYYQWEAVAFPQPRGSGIKKAALEGYGIALARALCFTGLRVLMEHEPMPCPSNKKLFLETPGIMGILNVTADSFSDGGKYSALDAAVARALEMVAEGANSLDLGAESTRPGARGISARDQKNRLVPLLKALRKKRALKNIPLSIDTQSSEVARACLEEGADVINDVSALRKDKKMAKVVAKADCPVILMHMKGSPRSMQKNPTYKDVMGEIDQFFCDRIKYAFDAGISPVRILLDPERLWNIIVN